MVAKLTDVAKIAGVSPSTVSRVINKYGYLSEKTITKVQQAMKELNYQPNNFARSLQGKRPHLIGLIFPSMSNPFYGELEEAIEKTLFNAGYKTIIGNSLGDPAKEESYLSMLAANQVDAVIAGSHNVGIGTYENSSLPIISFDRNLGSEIPIVSSDNYAGGQLAAETLIKRGAENFALFTGPDSTGSPTALRAEGFNALLAKKNLTAKRIRMDPSSAVELRQADAADFLKNYRPDGIFASDDIMAILIQQESAKLLNYRPLIIGYDGTQILRELYPNLTTIIQPIQAIAEKLVQLTIQRIEQPDIVLKKQYVLPVKLWN